MKITFRINYRTKFGQKIFVVGNHTKLGKDFDNKAVEMPFFNGDTWELELELADAKKFSLSYKYLVKDEKSSEILETSDIKSVEISPEWSNNLVVNDFWMPSDSYLNAYLTSPFKEIFFKDLYSSKHKSIALKKSSSHRFSISIPFLLEGKSICILGSSQELGSWDWNNFTALNRGKNGEYYIDLNLAQQISSIEYKYGIYDISSNKLLELEAGANRSLTYSLKAKDEKYYINDLNFVKEFNQWKAAGVAIPVFSLRSKNSMGVGEFLDIKLLVDWSVKTKMKLIQILPINDTIASHTWVDSYPYAAISVFALHPIYLNLQKAGVLASKLTQEILSQVQESLNSHSSVDYEKVMSVKLKYIAQVYKESKLLLDADNSFQQFVEANAHWLKPYAAFSFLRDLYQSPDFSKWGRFANYSDKILDELCDPKSVHFSQVEVHYFTQYHLHLQLLEASAYAHKNGVILKGDIPIGIYRNSVDAWTEPHLYNMQMQAGAPPDDFAVKGQNWGFPTYNWDQMSKDNYKWWTNRLKKLADYFDTFRIDHILGFFRIWQIPMHAIEGILGYFNPAIAINPNEFAQRGLDFSPERYCRPYIREHILLDKFKDKKDYVKSVFLIDKGFGVYQLKDEFSTQRKVDDFLRVDQSFNLEQKTEMEQLKKGLFDLIADIIFIEIDNNGKMEYHPRHSLQKTFSFQELDNHSKDIVNFIYNDYFYNRQEEFWKDRAMEKLPSIKNATEMLICGEDLGMVPAVVPGVMNKLGILSLEVQRMPKDTGIEFFHPANAPYLSVVTSSSHDMSTIRGWWEEDYQKSQRFYNQILGHSGLAPVYADSWIVRDVVNQHLYSPAMWCILPIQDYIGIDDKLRYPVAKDEQINIPANIPHYWKYRFHLNMEDLLKEEEFNNRLKQMVEKSNRA